MHRNFQWIAINRAHQNAVLVVNHKTLLMKPLLTLTICFVLLFQLKAQETNPYRTLKNEISVGLVSGGEIFNSDRAMPGFGYKRFINESAIRVMIGGTANTLSNGDAANRQSSSDIATSIRLGYRTTLCSSVSCQLLEWI